MSLKSLDGGGAVGEAPDGWESLHGKMKGVGVFIAASDEKGLEGRGHRKQTQTNMPTHTDTQKDIKQTWHETQDNMLKFCHSMFLMEGEK